MTKERLDILLAERNLAPSREKAKALIMAGCVYVNNIKEDKPGTRFEKEVPIFVKNNKRQYVSRGGYKLEKALKEFKISLTGKTCVDIGASTGGFTDCMLQNGAVKVFAVDAGYGQLDWKLRCDQRVICMEKTNIRYVTEKTIEEKCCFASVDISFISLTKALQNVSFLLDAGGEMVCLVKPQFEAGRSQVGKKGVVKDKKIHADVIRKIIAYSKSLGLYPAELSYSPIKGPEGNIEYLLYIKKEPHEFSVSLENIVNESHEMLGGAYEK